MAVHASELSAGFFSNVKPTQLSSALQCFSAAATVIFAESCDVPKESVVRVHADNVRAQTTYKIVPSSDETVRDLVAIRTISWQHQCQLLLSSRLYMLCRVSPVPDEPLCTADDSVVPLPDNQRISVNLAGRVERVVEEWAILNEDK